MKKWVLAAAAIVAGILTLGLAAGCTANTADLKVVVHGPDGVPLSGAKVVSNEQPEGQLKVTGLTGDDGSATFAGIKPGDYQFTISRFDYEPKDVSYKVVAGHMEVNVTLAKASG